MNALVSDWQDVIGLLVYTSVVTRSLQKAQKQTQFLQKTHRLLTEATSELDSLKKRNFLQQSLTLVPIASLILMVCITQYFLKDFATAER